MSPLHVRSARIDTHSQSRRSMLITLQGIPSQEVCRNSTLYATINHFKLKDTEFLLRFVIHRLHVIPAT